MSNFLVPNTFVPGTKAKAQDVNENFSAVQNELNLKAEKLGDINQTFLVASATQDNHAITKKQVETLFDENLDKVYKDFLIPFSVKSGYTDENGDSAVISAENGILNFNVDNGSVYKPLIAVPANNQAKITITDIESVDVSSYVDGKYNLFLTSEGSVYLLNNEMYVQKSRPQSPLLNCIFENTSVFPITVEKFNGTNWEMFNDVYLGFVQIVDGIVSRVYNVPFNNNWACLSATELSTANQNRPAVVVENYVNGNSWYRIYSDGWCEQGGMTNAVSISKQGGNSQTVTFLKTFRDTNYSATVTGHATSSDAGRCAGCVQNSLSTKSMKCGLYNFNTSSSQNIRAVWSARGYLAQGEY